MSHFELVARERGLDGRWAIEQAADGPATAGLEYTVSWIAEVG